MTSQAAATTPPAVAQGALVIVGAGIAGLNALYAASRYLKPTDKVFLIDRHARAGGMWTETYDYVRLHQPHPMFTAGDIPWTLGQAPAHLATRQQVLEHFAHCLAELRQRVELVEYYGYDYLGHEEVQEDGAWCVHVQIAPLAVGGRPLRIRADHCVKALGFRIPKNDPLSFSSTQVVSLAPQDAALFGPSLAPVYVIGGGKTGMDTAHTLLSRCPAREVHLVVGQGTLFTNRNKAFPTGLARWWGGNTTLAMFLDLALRFDGDNEADVRDHFRARYALSLGANYQHFVLGLLSEEENAFIARGIAGTLEDYVEDVADIDGVPTLRLRSGATRAVASGTVFVNCTGYVMREAHDYEPYRSTHGCVVSVQPTSAIHILTTFAAYFLVHLLYLGKLDSLPLYEMDQESLFRINKVVTPYAAMVQILLNTTLIVNATPFSVIDHCGLDFDRWYPLPRRLLNALRLKRNSRAYIAHFQRCLDRLAARHGMRCGVLAEHAAPNSGMETATR